MAVEKGFGAEQDQRDDVLSGHALSKGLSQEFGLRPVVQLPYCRIDEEGDGEFTDNHQAGTKDGEYVEEVYVYSSQITPRFFDPDDLKRGSNRVP
jgi:hypothetical protein